MPSFACHGCTQTEQVFTINLGIFVNDHHTYKRIHRLRANRVDKKNGILYLGDGCWGVDTRAVPKPGTSCGTWPRPASRRHLICVTVQNGKPSYVAYEADGKVIDQHA